MGSFTSAAAEIGLTQAAVSQRIRNLEARVGAELFTRQARGVTLTVDGEAWLPYVTNALQSLNRSAEDLFGKPLKKITISAGAGVSQLWIAPRLSQINENAKYQISLSTMSIEVDYAQSNALIEIRYGTGNWPNMRKARLYKESLVPLASPELLKKGTPWQELPLIAASGPRPGWQEWSLKAKSTSPSIPTFRFDSFTSARAAALAGAGVVLGSLPLCAKDLAEKSLIRLSDISLDLNAGYWMTSKEDKLPRKQWDELVGYLCQPLTY